MKYRRYLKYRGGFSKAGGRAAGSNFKGFPAKKIVPNGNGLLPYLTANALQMVYNRATGNRTPQKRSSRSVRVDPSSGSTTVLVPKYTPTSPRIRVNAPKVIGAPGRGTMSRYVTGRQSPALERKLVDSQSFVYQRIRSYVYSNSLGLQSNASQVTLNADWLHTITSTLQQEFYGDPDLQPSSKFWIKRVEQEIKFVNSANVNAYLDIYEVEPKRDTLFKTGQDYPQCTPALSWQSGLILTQPDGVAVNQITPFSLGATPFMSPMFTQFWAVKNIQRVELPAGATHVHYSTYHINKLFDTALISITNVEKLYGNLRDFTKHHMFVIQGQLVHSELTPANVTTSGTSVDTLTSSKVYCAEYKGAATMTQLDSSLPNVSDPYLYTTNSPKDEAVRTE